MKRRRLPILLLATLPLAAAVPGLNLDLRTGLGQNPAAEIQLVPAGAWRGLLQSGAVPLRPRPHRRQVAGATVEVVDFLPPEDARTEAFTGFSADLRQRLDAAWRHPPASHAFVDLALFMGTDPAHPEQLGPTMVRSLQDRFNALPPEGSSAPAR